MSEYFAFLFPFTVQFISLTSYSHPYYGTQCTYISFTIVDKMFATKFSVSFNVHRNVLSLHQKKALPLSFIITCQGINLCNTTPHPPELLTDILQKLTLIVLQDLGPPVAIPQSFWFGVFYL